MTNVEQSCYEDAWVNIQYYLMDCPLHMKVVRSDHVSESGRYRFLLSPTEYPDKTIEVLMPGVQIEKVRYLGEEGQNILDYPRLYVNGVPYVWKYALVTRQHFHALMAEADETCRKVSGQ